MADIKQVADESHSGLPFRNHFLSGELTSP